MIQRTTMLLLVLLAGCTSNRPIDTGALSEVFVKDFHSSEPAACTTADVELGHADALHFFQRATPHDRRTIDDNYPVAPCRIEGTLKHHDRLCAWTITAAATGKIRCGEREQYFACDDCEDLFRH